MDIRVESQKKIELNIKDIIPGMVVAQTLTNQYGAAIIHEHATLSEHMIQKLENLGFTQVPVYSMNEEKIEHNEKHFSISYDQGKDMIKDMFTEAENSRVVDMNKLRTVSTLLLEQVDNHRDVVESIGKIRAVDEYTYTHSINVALLCSLIGKWLNFDEITIRLLTYTGLLHDFGKSKIPVHILNKPNKLTEKEFEIMKTHPILGFKMLEKNPSINQNILMGILMHHEREDGSGYPFGKKGSEINYFAKIVALADIYDAMTSQRIYKNRQTPFEVLEMFENHSFGRLDPHYLMVFISRIANYYVGDFVKLNSGQTAEIIYINPHHVSRPLLKIDDTYVDLYEEPSLKIVELY